MLAAMDNPYLTIIGHPTGRLLLSRDPYGLDLDAIIEKAAARGVALEINADPHRLDLDWRVLRRVREGGAMISIGADAHSTAGLAYVEYGVGDGAEGLARPRRHSQRAGRSSSSSPSPDAGVDVGEGAARPAHRTGVEGRQGRAGRAHPATVSSRPTPMPGARSITATPTSSSWPRSSRPNAPTPGSIW